MCIRDRIYTVASGYGQTGPYAPRPGFDRMGLALGGFLEVTGYPEDVYKRQTMNSRSFLATALLLIARPILLAIPVLNRASPTIHIPATIITVELEKPEYTSESFI